MLGELIIKKIKGKELTREEYRTAVSKILLNKDDADTKKFLVALNSFGMTFKEVRFMAEAIRDSGYVLNEEVTFEKHSTGGIGDSTSLVIIPLLASLGYKVVKITNKSIRYTNGGRDRFGSIPNFNCELNENEIHNVLDSTNACILSNCGKVCPADKVLSDLRVEYEITDDMNLIAAGLVGKKLASGAKIVLIDIKYGASAFIQTYKKARKLAKLLKNLFAYFKVESIIILTNTNQTIGEAIGNAVEVVDAIEVLQGKKCLLRDISVEYAAEMILKANKLLNKNDAIDILESAIDTGVAYQKFLEIVKAQGGDDKKIINKQLCIPAKTINFVSQSEGYVGRINTLLLGELIRRLCLRSHDNNIGAIIKVKLGDYIKKGDVIITLHYKNKNDVERYRKAIEGCVRITKHKFDPVEVIRKVIR